MYNYRRVYTNSAKFKTIYGDLKLPVFIDTRIAGVLEITAVIDAVIIFVFKLYTVNKLDVLRNVKLHVYVNNSKMTEN